MRLIERETPADLDLHLVPDNYATHNHPMVRAWLAKRPRFHLHFTPTSAFWLNQVERWFAFISQRAIKHGSFNGVPHLVRTIKSFIDDYNETAARSSGSRPPIRSSVKSKDDLCGFAGHNISARLKIIYLPLCFSAKSHNKLALTIRRTVFSGTLSHTPTVIAVWISLP